MSVLTSSLQEAPGGLGPEEPVTPSTKLGDPTIHGLQTERPIVPKSTIGRLKKQCMECKDSLPGAMRRTKRRQQIHPSSVR